MNDHCASLGVMWSASRVSCCCWLLERNYRHQVLATQIPDSGLAPTLYTDRKVLAIGYRTSTEYRSMSSKHKAINLAANGAGTVITSLTRKEYISVRVHGILELKEFWYREKCATTRIIYGIK